MIAARSQSGDQPTRNAIAWDRCLLEHPPVDPRQMRMFAVGVAWEGRPAFIPVDVIRAGGHGGQGGFGLPNSTWTPKAFIGEIGGGGCTTFLCRGW